jgi:hypothetical protein
MFSILLRFYDRKFFRIKHDINGFFMNFPFYQLSPFFSKIILIPTYIFFLLLSCKENPTTPSEPLKPPGYQEDIPWPSLANSPWPMYRRDPQNTGRSNFKGPQLGTLSKKIPAYNLEAGIIVGPDSTIYFVTSNPSALTAVKYDGTIKWERLIGIAGGATPLINKKGNIYACDLYTLYCFNSKGDTLWKYKFPDMIMSNAINIGLDGSVFIIDRTNTLYAISKDGELKNKITDNRMPKGLAFHIPAISPDGKTIYVQGKSVSLLAVDIESMTVKWAFGDTILYHGPMVDNQGNIYILPGETNLGGINKYRLYSLIPSGDIRWMMDYYTSDIFGSGEPTIDKFGNVYFGNDSLYSLSYDGSINWKNNYSIRSPIICDDECNIFFAKSTYEIFSLNSNGTLNWEVIVSDERSLIAPIIGENNLLYFPTYRSKSIIEIK